jgi:RHS repeat-associated protein
MDDEATDLGAAGFGLMYYNARWYDPYLNHFTQPDSIVPLASQGTQAWDRYAYANNNPLRYTDLSGHKACEQACPDDVIDESMFALLNFVDTVIFDENGNLRSEYNGLSAMIAIVAKAAEIYGNDWNSFLSATNFIFLGVYENGPFIQVHAQENTFQGYNFEGPNGGGMNFQFDDGSSQVRHFWGAFATAASTNNQISGPFGDIPNSIIARGGNFVHDMWSDWRGDSHTTI